MGKKIVHDALILTAFTLVLGLILAVVYEITKDPIEIAKQEAREAAYREVFSDADSFTMMEYDKEAATASIEEKGYSDTIDDIEIANAADGSVLGYVITVTAKDGSQGRITFSVGIRSDGTVNGYSITDISESPGLGSKAADEEFYSQFENKQVDAFQVTKAKATAENQIEAITGSTITSKAMVNGVNAALEYFRSDLQGGVQ